MTFKVQIPSVPDKPELNLKGQVLSVTLPITDPVSCVCTHLCVCASACVCTLHARMCVLVHACVCVWLCKLCVQLFDCTSTAS